MIRSIPEYSLDQITKTATEIKKKGLKTFDSISHEPHIWLNEFEKLVSTNIGMEKEVILEFLDEISLDFYYKITRSVSILILVFFFLNFGSNLFIFFIDLIKTSLGPFLKPVSSILLIITKS